MNQTTYTLSIDYRDCGNWLETGDPSSTFDDLDEAKAAADAADEGDYGPGEYRAVVTDDDRDEVYTYEWKVDPEQDKYDAATWLVEDEGEYSTASYGIGENGEYLYTSQNGGSRGAHSRQEGDGRWSNMADEIEEISLVQLLGALISHEGGDVMDAVKVVAEAHPEKMADDLILEIANEWEWSDDEKESVGAWLDADDPIYSDEIREALGLPETEA